MTMKTANFASFACLLLAIACTRKPSTDAPDGGGTNADDDGFRIAKKSASETPPAGDDKDKPPKWDVEHPPGATKDVKIDVDEGTWMSVDVSPDGKMLVFDLLGDLYTLPIG